ncbi:hypothetical protein MWU75_07185 [Ornithinimicrobium sp. F0845]|uniref:hypothetical protein n=1 Tax=Ornithinimicrobium sp. F0845 TaxID=2926412 RepID=UPI001FF3951C|nr:hypothetical protein [Ornithinimicrobium sp. F0845]MCK0111918.1 hypothetical protein [Ornithinimicrobium sp. F0845]
MTEQLINPQAVRDLVRAHRLLGQAEAESRAAQATLERSRVRPEHSGAVHAPLPPDVARLMGMASAFADLAEEVHLLFPADVGPEFAAWPLEPTGADPLYLAREAEQLTRRHPLAEFPTGTGTLVVRLMDAIRVFS